VYYQCTNRTNGAVPCSSVWSSKRTVCDATRPYGAVRGPNCTVCMVGSLVSKRHQKSNLTQVINPWRLYVCWESLRDAPPGCTRRGAKFLVATNNTIGTNVVDTYFSGDVGRILSGCGRGHLMPVPLCLAAYAKLEGIWFAGGSLRTLQPFRRLIRANIIVSNGVQRTAYPPVSTTISTSPFHMLSYAQSRIRTIDLAPPYTAYSLVSTRRTRTKTDAKITTQVNIHQIARGNLGLRLRLISYRPI